MLVLISCNSQKSLNKNPNKIKEKEFYEVYKIDSIGNYYLIFAKKQDSIYKIVSKKDVTGTEKRIKINKKYPFSLKSKRSLAPTINGVKIAPLNVDCFVFDKETSICIDRKNNIYDLYFADNIKGLCFIKNCSKN